MSFKHICSTTIHGERWDVGFGYTGKTDGKVNEGLCHHARKRIILHSKDRGRQCTLIDVTIHELLHSFLPCLSEDTVNEFGELCGRVLPKVLAAEPDKQTLDEA